MAETNEQKPTDTAAVEERLSLELLRDRLYGLEVNWRSWNDYSKCQLRSKQLTSIEEKISLLKSDIILLENSTEVKRVLGEYGDRSNWEKTEESDELHWLYLGYVFGHGYEPAQLVLAKMEEKQ